MSIRTKALVTRRLFVSVAIALTGVCTASDAVQAEDTAAPDPPTGIVVAQGPDWQNTNTFDVWWMTPLGQDSPIAVAHYQLCPAVPLGPCTDHAVEGIGISQLRVELPHPGWFWIRVWLEDEAGNVNPAAKSPQSMLRFDDAEPPVAVFGNGEKWLDKKSPQSPTYSFEIPFSSEWPMSGIWGYSISVDGSVPDASVDTVAAQDYERFPAIYKFPSLDEGVTHVRFRSVSNAGVPSAAVGSGYIRVDRSSPVLTEVRQDLAEWQRRTLLLAIGAADQDHLSGMRPSAGSVVEDGAHLVYSLNGGDAVKVPGDHASVPIETDGHHTLTYRAFDAAGNASVEKEVVVRIDGTAPVGRFKALDSGNPRRLEVEVSDATSGVAGGRVEYRKVGDGEFRALPTTMGHGVLAARVDDEALPAGRYELRAVVSDVAGNEAVVGRWADGTEATLGLPLRRATRIEVAGEGARKACPKTAGKSNGKRQSKGKRRPVCRRAAKRAAVLEPRFGKRARTTGRLTTAQGAAIGGATIVVEARHRSGGDQVRLGAVQTGADGRFRFAVPAGPSRTVRYRYGGTDTALPATAAVTTKVPAAARLKASRRRLRNGQTVQFTGRLLGRPVPTAGKVVALQAKVGRRWRTFANPRANAKGAFRHRYRFTATTGVRRYAFRAVVAREAAYPYERGTSPVVRVTVRGR